MADKSTFGIMNVEAGERCTNTPGITYFTTPCCYADVDDEDTKECPECGAPIICEMVAVEQAVCRIADPDEIDEQ